MLIRINDINLDYRDQGHGAPVIFIHAFPLNQHMWDAQLEILQTFCRVITVDLRGFGGSDSPPGPYTMDDMAADVRGLMKGLGIDRALLVGLSMGGYVSLAFYRNFPDALSGLVLADTRATADTSEARERRLKSADKAEREGVHAIAAEMIPLLLGRTTRESRQTVVDQVRRIIESNSSRGIAEAQRCMSARPDSTHLLTMMNLPVLIIVGSEDTLTPVAEAESLRNAIPGAQLLVIEGAGHLTNLEHPDQFNTALIKFIEENAR